MYAVQFVTSAPIDRLIATKDMLGYLVSRIPWHAQPDERRLPGRPCQVLHLWNALPDKALRERSDCHVLHAAVAGFLLVPGRDQASSLRVRHAGSRGSDRVRRDS